VAVIAAEPSEEALRTTCRAGDVASCHRLAALVEGIDDDATGEATRSLALDFLHERDGLPYLPGLAARLFEHACIAEEMTSCSHLGYLVATGEGVPRDLPRSVELYEKACDGGAPEGCANLSFAYAEGLGVPKDEGRAFVAAAKACLDGNAVGCNNVGGSYLATADDFDQHVRSASFPWPAAAVAPRVATT